MEETQNRLRTEGAACLLARKPYSFDDLRGQIDHALTATDVRALKGNAHYKILECKGWGQLMLTDLSTARWWQVTLKDEGVRILIDTQGYTYPRYVGVLG